MANNNCILVSSNIIAMEISDLVPDSTGAAVQTLESRISSLPRAEMLRTILAIVNGCTGSREVMDLVETEVAKAEAVRAKVDRDAGISAAKATKLKRKQAKPFDMSKYSQRHVAIQLQYDGSKYYGFAAQKDEFEETVEKYLFEALLKLRLIESRQSCNYSRCGRTDKGVSAMRQVVAFNLRSNVPKGVAGGAVVAEVDYCNLLNKSLPPEIRALGSCFVSADFSARFSATHRTYRYFFVRRNLNTTAMLEAAQFLIGSHDFRNLCKLDAANVTNFEREILFVNLVLYHESPLDREHDIMYVEISGLAFLWHMVRCIMAVLFMVGKGLEQPQIVRQLLDVSSEPAKPDYSLAADTPLLLYDCGFKNIDFQYNTKVLKGLETHYEEQWELHEIAAARMRTCLDWIQECRLQPGDVDEVRRYMHSQRSKKIADESHSPKVFKSCDEVLAAGVESGFGDEVPERKRRRLDYFQETRGKDMILWGHVKTLVEDDAMFGHTPLLQVGGLHMNSLL